MKKFFALLLTMAMSVSVLAGCGGSEAEAPADDAAERTTFTVGFDAEYPPYGYRTEDGDYAGFGQVIEGMDVVNKIAGTRTDFRDRPMAKQMMKKVTVETFGVELYYWC